MQQLLETVRLHEQRRRATKKDVSSSQNRYKQMKSPMRKQTEQYAKPAQVENNLPKWSRQSAWGTFMATCCVQNDPRESRIDLGHCLFSRLARLELESSSATVVTDIALRSARPSYDCSSVASRSSPFELSVSFVARFTWVVIYLMRIRVVLVVVLLLDF